MRPDSLVTVLRHATARAATVIAFTLAGSLLPRLLPAQDATPSARTTADSTFTDAQAERGAQVFTRICLECHAREDMRNPDFKGKWSGQTTFDLFKNISTTMPDNNPGMLALTEYVDVVAYILKLNGVPSGAVELAADSTAMRAAKMNLPAAASGAALVQRVVRPSRAAPPTWLAFAHGRRVTPAR